MMRVKSSYNLGLWFFVIVVVIVVYFNLYFVFFFAKNLFGKDFPVKEHDELNKFHDNPTNFVDDMYYSYCSRNLEKWNRYHDALPKTPTTFVLPSINADQISQIAHYTNNYRTPLVIKGLIKDFPCVKKWDIDYLKKNCGQHTVKGFAKTDGSNFITNQFNNVKVLENVRFSNACDMIRNGEQIYINNFHSIFIDCAVLQEDLDLKKLNEITPIEYLEVSQLFFGPKGTGTTLHCAMKSNIFYNVKGRKKWTFIDPAYSQYLSAVLSDNGIFVVSKLNYFNDPSLLRNIPKFEYTLEEGDVLFNPSWWWHCVENMSEYTIGVANRSSLGFKFHDNNNHTFTINSMLTRPYQLYKIINAPTIDVDVTGKVFV
jgi:hypothetical protein